MSWHESSSKWFSCSGFLKIIVPGVIGLPVEADASLSVSIRRIDHDHRLQIRLSNEHGT